MELLRQVLVMLL